MTALVRSQAAGRAAGTPGGRCVLGDLSSWDGLRPPPRGYDAYVHTAFECVGARRPRSTRRRSRCCRRWPRRGDAQALVYTSGIWVLGSTPGADETAPVNPAPLVAFRPAWNERVLEAAGDRHCGRASSGPASCSAAAGASSATCCGTPRTASCASSAAARTAGRSCTTAISRTSTCVSSATRGVGHLSRHRRQRRARG